MPAVHTPPQDVHEKDWEVNAGMEATSVGTSPVRALSQRLMDERAVRVDSWTGMLPFNALPRRSRSCNACIADTSAGMGPVNVRWYRTTSCFRETSAEMDDGS